jgi:hypothetical protein
VLPRASITFWISALSVSRGYRFFFGIGIRDGVWLDAADELDDAADGCGEGVDMVTRFEILSISGAFTLTLNIHSDVLFDDEVAGEGDEEVAGEGDEECRCRRERNVMDEGRPDFPRSPDFPKGRSCSCLYCKRTRTKTFPEKELTTLNTLCQLHPAWVPMSTFSTKGSLVSWSTTSF